MRTRKLKNNVLLFMRSRKGSDIAIDIGSTKELGELIMHERKAQGLTQPN